MADLPARFTTDLEDSLNISISAADNMVDQPSTYNNNRRWDDPPEEEPTVAPDTNTTLILVNTFAMRSPYYASEIMHLSFTPSGAHLVAAVPKGENKYSLNPEGPFALAVWSAETGAALSWNKAQVGRGFAVMPVTGPGVMVACPSLTIYTQHVDFNMWAKLEVWDCRDAGKNQRLLKQDHVPIRAPVAWSPDGTVLVGVSIREPSRMLVVRMQGRYKGMEATVGRVLMGHGEEVTQLAFLPPWEGDGRALVSAGTDGYVRVTSVESGRTLKKIEIGMRARASILRVSPDGKLVVTVWGREVVLWYLDSGRVHHYNMNALRQSEGWPLCVSPDCRYLACRTEEGFDVSDVATGKFRGEYAWTGNPITSAAFNGEGTRLAVGDYRGVVQMFDIVTP
ncbi:YVTN repeat-like/Quino protein amine dehydrogenase [Parathielavia appendiculata]|uniref:YVTN repeat-like/Quino protein amine dehydrogenase n=1 Tax=Parathielavia appendiculata TaxID=2587402 RepID=A0AAN6Z4W6_9PEZI|nr:YVTN repeat-like/Quino protein amine dehydrogenase [Parathielavia appendiculata]